MRCEITLHDLGTLRHSKILIEETEHTDTNEAKKQYYLVDYGYLVIGGGR